MDGYAIRHADFSSGEALPLQGHVYAGQQSFALKAGYAIRVFTGAPLPENADTVVMQEHVTARDDAVLITVPPEKVAIFADAATMFAKEQRCCLRARAYSRNT